MNVLGSMMLSDKAADEASLMVGAEDFYRPAHRDIFASILELIEQRLAVDLVTVKNRLIEKGLLERVGGVDYLIEICESVASPANAQHYARIVIDKATDRRLQQAGHEIQRLIHDSDLTTVQRVDEAERLVFEVGQNRLGDNMASAYVLSKAFFDDIDHVYETGNPILGVNSGFVDLNELTGGFFEKDFIVLAARPAMGKTSLVLNMALAAARAQKGAVAIFSLEMGGKQLVQRMLAVESKVSLHAMRRTRISDDEYQRLVDACETFHSLPLYVDESSDISAMEMRGKCRRLKADQGLALVVVDYLQLMRGSRRTENRVQEISEVARSLKAMAKELDCPVVALSQLNRGVESRENKRPMLSDLRESGSIEAEADLVMFIYRHSYYQRKEAFDEMPNNPLIGEVAEVIVAKHRNGPVGTVLLGFQPMLTNFCSLAPTDKEAYLRSLKDNGPE